jgi:hypothetical protein
VERGDYKMIRTEDSLTIDPSDFVSSVRQEMILEMSIILRQRIALKDIKGKCPRCQYINSSITVVHGWIEWKVPSKSIVDALTINMLTCSGNCPSYFQITESDIVDSDTAEGVENIMSPVSYMSLFYCWIIDDSNE